MDNRPDTTNGALASEASSRRARTWGPASALWCLSAVGVLGLTLSLLAAGRLSRLRRPPTPAPLPVLFAIPPFTLTNQSQRMVSLNDLRGQVWLANIIFTRCAGPCPKLTQRMSEIQSALAARAPVKLVTLTTDPDHDTPEVLERYGQRLGAQFGRWWFLTGDKAALMRLAVDGLKFVAAETPAAERGDDADLFLHSTFFILVDQQGRARGVYHYSDPGMKDRVLEDIDRLLREGIVSHRS